METGIFRQDLFYRLGGVTITVPALRERVEDIALLTDHFLARSEREGAPTRKFSKDAAGYHPRLFLARQCAPAGERRAAPCGHIARGRNHAQRGGTWCSAIAA